MTRIYKKLTGKDLIQMREFALEELDRFLYHAGSPRGKFRVYQKRLIAICLCQGAAQHYMQGQPRASYDKTLNVRHQVVKEKRYRKDRKGRVLAGIRDIDIWFFFRPHPKVRIPHIKNCRKHTTRSFDRLGTRDIDFMKKTIGDNIMPGAKSGSTAQIVRSYLRNANTQTSNYLAEASVLGLYPSPLLGRPIWRVEWLRSRHSGLPPDTARHR